MKKILFLLILLSSFSFSNPNPADAVSLSFIESEASSKNLVLTNDATSSKNFVGNLQSLNDLSFIVVNETAQVSAVTYSACTYYSGVNKTYCSARDFTYLCADSLVNGICPVPVCVPEPLDNVIPNGFFEAVSHVQDITFKIEHLKANNPDIIDTQLQQEDTCGNYWYINANNFCPNGQIPTAYAPADDNTSSLFNCQPDSNYTCDNGYTKDSNGICQPDINCPYPMIYQVTDAWHGYWANDKRCVPNTDLTESECNSIPGAFYNKLFTGDENKDMFAIIYGEGCSSLNFDAKTDFLQDDINDVLHFMPFSPLWNSSNDLVVQGIDKLFGVGKNLFNAIKNKFSNSTVNPKPNLQTYEPEIIDMEIGSDGVAYEVNLNPKTPPKDNPQGWWDTYQKFRDNGWDFPEQTSSYDASIHDQVPPTVNTPKFPIVSQTLDDLIYKGGDSKTFNNSMIGTANLSKDAIVPDLAPLETSSINQQVQTTVNLNSKLLGTVNQSYPTTLLKDSEIALSDRVETTYRGYVTYPDGSKTFLDISRTKYNVDGHTIDNVITKTDIQTESGTKIFNTTYQTFKDGTGAVTNTVNGPSSIVTNNGTTTTTTTNTVNNPITTNNGSGAIDLLPVLSKLDSIDSKIQTIIDTPIPQEIAEATVRIQEFKTATDIFDVDFNTYLDFANGMIDNANEITTLFDDTKAILENKPVVNEINGQCGFDMNYHGTNLHVDICAFVFPYRPILALIFTLLGTFAVLGFTVKYLVSKGD